MMRELIKLVLPDSMKSSHPKRSGHDDIKQKTTRRRDSSARLDEAARPSVSLSSVVMQSKCGPPRDATKKEAIPLGRRGR
jgi:hypothetical protein